MGLSEQKKLQQYLIRRGVRYLKSYPHARYEDVREKLMDINYKGTAKDHPSFAYGFLTDTHIKWVAAKVCRYKPYKIKKLKQKEKVTMIKTDITTEAMRLAQEKYGKEFHPLSQMFPCMASDDLAVLRDNVAKNPPDVVKVDMLGGKVLEGKNMMLVAALLGLKVEFVEYEGNDPIGFLLTRNLHRRHLTISQRAYVAARMVTTTLGSNQHKGTGIPEPSITEVTQPEAARLLGISVDSVSGASKILTSGNEEIIGAIRHGKKTINAAIRELNLTADADDSAEDSVLDEKKAAKVIKRYAGERYVDKMIDLMKSEGETNIDKLLGKALVAYCEARSAR